MILLFKNDYDWLANSAEVSVILDGMLYPSVEHAYQAAKVLDSDWHLFCKLEKKAEKVIQHSGQLEIRPDWHELKFGIMWDLVVQKFSQEPYRSLLLDTGNKYIIKGNSCGDKFWGVDLDSGEGQNVLGHLIMKIRKRLSYEVLRAA